MAEKTVVEELRDLLKKIADILPQLMIPVFQSKDGRFIRNSDGTVTDKQLNLIWYPTLPKKFTWEEAKKACEKTGCRLPTRRELDSLVDITKHDPATDKEIFPDTKSDWFWTSTSCAWNSDYAWIVFFYYGIVSSDNKDGYSYVRPVRSSQ